MKKNIATFILVLICLSISFGLLLTTNVTYVIDYSEIDVSNDNAYASTPSDDMVFSNIDNLSFFEYSFKMLENASYFSELNKYTDSFFPNTFAKTSCTLTIVFGIFVAFIGVAGIFCSLSKLYKLMFSSKKEDEVESDKSLNSFVGFALALPIFAYLSYTLPAALGNFAHSKISPYLYFPTIKPQFDGIDYLYVMVVSCSLLIVGKIAINMIFRNEKPTKKSSSK